MCFVRENSCAANDVSVFVENFSVIANGLTYEIFWISFFNLPYCFTISTQDFSTLANFETLED